VPLNLKPPNPPLNASINPVVRAGGRIEVLLRGHSVFLDLETEGEDRGECVCEL